MLHFMQVSGVLQHWYFGWDKLFTNCYYFTAIEGLSYIGP